MACKRAVEARIRRLQYEIGEVEFNLRYTLTVDGPGERALALTDRLAERREALRRLRGRA